MDIKKIIREEIEKLNEEIQSDLVLPKGKRVVLQADNPKVNRGLVVTWLEDGGYNVEYWYKDPSKIYPAEVVIDGKPITTDGKVVYLGYHPELDEGFGSDEFLTKTEKKKFEKERLENAEVLGYTLTGTKDIKESVNEATLKMSQYKTSIKKLSHSQQDKLFDFLHKLKLMTPSDFMHYRNDRLHIAKSSITPKIKKFIERKFKIRLKESTKEYGKTLVNMIKDRKLKMLSSKDKKTLLKIVKMMKRANESVFAVRQDKIKNGERYPEQPNINYDPEKGKSRIRKIRK